MKAACVGCGGRTLELFCRVSSWEIRRCRNCGLGSTWPSPSSEELAACYPPSYLGDTVQTLADCSSGKLQRSRSWRNETDKVRLVERFLNGGRILDVGCGDGKFLGALDRQRWRRAGVEQIREVVELVGSKLPGLELACGDLHSVRLEPGSFDAITFWHVLEHLADPLAVLGRAAELLRPGGWLFISVPNFDSLQARLFRSHWLAFDVPRHLYHFSPGALERLLEQAGLQLRRRLFFSRRVSFHHLKHSVVHWSEAHFGGRVPYYALKPLLFAFPLLERLTGKYGILTTVAQRSR